MAKRKVDRTWVPETGEPIETSAPEAPKKKATKRVRRKKIVAEQPPPPPVDTPPPKAVILSANVSTGKPVDPVDDVQVKTIPQEQVSHAKRFYLDPSARNAHVLIVYFQNPKWGHSGLGVNGSHSLRVLRAAGIHVDGFGAQSFEALRERLKQDLTITHCILEAPWLLTEQLTILTAMFPHVHFIVRCHSNVSFLQLEAGAVKLLREQLCLSEYVLNLTISGNSTKFCEFVERVYGIRCLHLPNLYNNIRHSAKGPYVKGKELRVASFGALRVLKNHATSVAAAMMLARERNQELFFYVNRGREEHGAGVLTMLRHLFTDVPWAHLCEIPWCGWAEFRRVVGYMDLMFQLSHTETFNLVTADGIAEGVPSVVSPSISWCPDLWQTDPDNPHDAANAAGYLLDHHTREVALGREMLQQYIDDSTKTWLDYLSQAPGG